jgi:hypothetical protein
MIMRIDVPVALKTTIDEMAVKGHRFPHQQVVYLLEKAVEDEQVLEQAAKRLLQADQRRELRSMLGLPEFEVDHD